MGTRRKTGTALRPDLTVKVRDGGRTGTVHALIAVEVKADGGREVLGLDVGSDEDGAGWLAFQRRRAARSRAALQVCRDGLKRRG